MDTAFIQEIWRLHRGKIIGLLLGFFMAILFIMFGFFRTLFILICMTVGYLIGKRIDEQEDIIEVLDRLLPPGYHR